MHSQRIFQLTILIFLLIGLFLLFEGWKLGVSGMYGPGPGMFAAVIGVALTAVAAVWLARISFGGGAADLPHVSGDRSGIRRVGMVVAALIGFALLLRPIGFNLSMFVLLLLLLLGFGRDRVPLKFVIALLASFGTHYVFESLLRVPLPYASLPLLRDMGL
jgi:hypothetical protein